jgi:hypothetical protein
MGQDTESWDWAVADTATKERAAATHTISLLIGIDTMGSKENYCKGGTPGMGLRARVT